MSNIMQLQETVKEIEPRRVTVQGTERTIYDVITSDGTKWTAWERELAERAYNLKDKPALLKVEVKQNGQYTNRSLKDIMPAGDALMGATLETFGGQATSGSSGVTVTTSGTGFDQNMNKKETQKSEEIHRQTAAKVVGNMAAQGGMTPQEFWSNIIDLARYFDTGAIPGSTPEALPGAQEQFTAQDESGRPPHTDDDIPF